VTDRRPYAPRLPREERREQLLDAALAVIDREGYAGASIDAIAREAGVTRPVVYSAFENLADLLYTLLDRHEQRALTQLLEALGTEPGDLRPQDILVATTRRLIDTVTSDPQTWRPILCTHEGTPAAVRERIEADRDLVRTRIQGLVEGLTADGPALDAEITAHAILAVAEHFGRLLIEQPERFDPERLVAALEKLLAALTVSG
jgi:AcrR family transcriptional regulator